MPEPLTNADAIDALWDYDQPVASEAAFRRALNDLSKDETAALRLELLTQIARALGLQRRFDEAHATLDVVEAALEDATSRAQVRYLLERGRVFNSSGQAERAGPYFAAAWEQASASGEEILAIDAAHMLAIVSRQESHAWNLRALEIAERSDHPRALH